MLGTEAGRGSCQTEIWTGSGGARWRGRGSHQAQRRGVDGVHLGGDGLVPVRRQCGAWFSSGRRRAVVDVEHGARAWFTPGTEAGAWMSVEGVVYVRLKAGHGSRLGKGGRGSH